MGEPFVMRILTGRHAGRYLVDADYQGITATDDAAKAKRLSVRDAYGNVAAAIDMLCTVIVPENAGTATDDDYRQFGEIAVLDMFQKPGPEITSLLVRFACRRSPGESLEQPEIPVGPSSGCLSVWEWVHRAIYAKMKDAGRAGGEG